MTDRGLHDEIARLDERLEDLAGAMERCRKIALASKAAIIVGAILLVAIVLGVTGDATALIVAAALLLGGIVVLGSNSSTARYTAADIATAEALRAELIGRLELRVVSEGGPS